MLTKEQIEESRKVMMSEFDGWKEQRATIPNPPVGEEVDAAAFVEWYMRDYQTAMDALAAYSRVAELLDPRPDGYEVQYFTRAELRRALEG